MTNELDQIDEAIILALQGDGRLSNREIARKLDLSETTIRKRLRRMEDQRLVRLGVVTDLGSIGLVAHGFLRLAVTANRLYDVAGALADYEEAHFVAISTGPYNITAHVAAPTRPLLLARVREVLAMEGVRNGELMEPDEHVKHRYDIAVSSAIMPE